MTLEIPLTTIQEKASKRHDGWYDQCVVSGTVENGVLRISIDDYNRIKQPKPTKITASDSSKTNGCCGKVTTTKTFAVQQGSKGLLEVV